MAFAQIAQIAQIAAVVAFGGPQRGEGEPPNSTAGEAPVGLSFTKGIPEHERDALRETFDQVLTRACEPPPCTHDCPEGARTIGLLIGGNTRDYTLHWEATAPTLDAPLVLDTNCELCSLVEFDEQFAGDMDALCARLNGLDTAPGQLQVSSEPNGARLRIDGDAPAGRGRTPWLGELAAGEHTVEVRAPGYHTEQHTLQIVGRVKAHEHFVLSPMHKRRPSGPGWTSLTLGIAMGVAGSVLLALDAKPVGSRCAGRNIDAYGNCRFVYATLPLGIGLSAAGAVAFATGMGLVVWSQRGGVGHRSAGLALHGQF